MLPELILDSSGVEDLDTKLERAFSRIRKKTAERERKRKKGNTSWSPELGDRVLIKS